MNVLKRIFKGRSKDWDIKGCVLGVSIFKYFGLGFQFSRGYIDITFLIFNIDLY